MIKPNILMFHRVSFSKSNNDFNELYYKRKMVYKIEDLHSIINHYLSNGYSFGSIQQCINSNNFFHLTFDDGFKEHLQVAKILKKKFNMNYDKVTFSISVGNSILKKYSGMDIIYELITNGKITKLYELLKTNNEPKNINEIKRIVANLSPNNLELIITKLKGHTINIDETFMNGKEIKELSSLFQIASHGITHRFLISHIDESKKEIKNSKKILQYLTGKSVDIFCYPEGKNNEQIQNYCQEAGYKYALSIRHEENNKYCIGRKIM